MNRILFPVIALLVVASCYLGYNKFKGIAVDNRHPITAIPADAAVVISVNNLSKTWGKLNETSNLWAQIKAEFKLDSIANEIELIAQELENHKSLSEAIDNQNSCLAIFKNDDKLSYVLAIHTSNQIKEEFKQLLLASKYSFDGQKASKGNLRIYFEHKQNLLLLSNSKSKLTQSLNNVADDYEIQLEEEFKSLYSFSPEEEIQIYFKPEKLSNLKEFGSWTSLNLEYNNQRTTLSGLTSIKQDSTSKTSNIYNDLFDVIPGQIEFFEWFGYNSFDDHINQHVDKNNLANLNVYFDNSIAQILGTRFDNQHIIFQCKANAQPSIAISSKGNALTNDLNVLFASDSVYQQVGDIQIYPVSKNFKTDQVFSSSAKMTAPLFFALNDIYYFVPNLSSAAKIITSVAQNKTYSSSSEFKSSIDPHFSNKSVWHIYTNNSEKYNKTLSKHLPKTLIKNAKEIGWQKNAVANNLIYNNLIISSNAKSIIPKMTEEIVSPNQIPIEFIPHPFVTRNHRTSTNEIIAYDIENTIYRIGANGDVKWSKPMNEPLIGEVKTIDLFGNNKFQTVFTTTNNIHLLDINGNTVDGFPIQLPSQVSSGLSVLDYEGNKDYRFVVGLKNGSIVNYDKTGKSVTGWSSNLNNDLLITPIKHFRIGSKDYLCGTTANGKTIALDRRGAPREQIPMITGGKKSLLLKGKSITSSRVLIADSGKIKGHYFSGQSFTNMLDTSLKSANLLRVNNSLIAIHDNEKGLIYNENMELKKIISFPFKMQLHQVFFQGGETLSVTSKGSTFYVLNQFGEIIHEETDCKSLFICELHPNSNPNLLISKGGKSQFINLNF